MGEVIFKIDEAFRRITEHAEQQGKPIMFVHDQGLYLCTAGLVAEEGKPNLLCAYAEGCDPSEGGMDWYDRARDLVGGDDFVEHFEPTYVAIWARAARAGFGRLVITVSESHLSARIE